MGTCSLRQLLRSICHNLRWEYAVFWKVQHQRETLLTWEDGFSYYPALRNSGEVITNNVCIGGTTLADSPSCDFDAFSGISLAVASMSCLQYSVGEGFVGRVAATGKHSWFSVDDFNASLLSDYPDEWQLQFAVGIKTILFVPVVPFGVVQLGSLEKVAQDLALVALIKDMFNNLLNVPVASIPLASHEDLYESSPPSPKTVLEVLSEPSAIAIQSTTQSRLTMNCDLLKLDDLQMTQEKLSTIDPDIKSQFMGQDNLQVQGIDACYARDAIFGATAGPTSVSQNKYSNKRLLEVMETDMPNFVGLEKYARQSSQELAFAATPSTNMKFGPNENMISKPNGDATGKETTEISSHGSLNFPLGSELHKALGLTSQNICYKFHGEPTVFGEDICSSSTLIYHSDPAEVGETSITESNGWYPKGGEANHLLGAVISNVYDASGNDACNRSNSARLPTTSSGQFAVSCQTESPSVCNVLRGSHSSPRSNRSSGFVHSNGEVLASSTSFLKHKANKLIDEKQERKGLSHIQSRKGLKSSNTNKRKGRLDIKKPRPRDRQMIQDRVKELRELVPNGAKCSIDALLHQTIKHMIFLRSITKQAEKLKNHIHPKVGATKNQKSFESQCRHQNGASWAFELGKEFGVCPIVVRDLDQPGHMLIEMVCEEHGLFLEIALVIRRLKLTILKGVLENRADKLWAHFIVEVSKSFQRMDIFWPLMQLLQPNHPMSIF